MRLKIFTIPIHGGDEAAEELNTFLASHRVLSIDKSWAEAGVNSAWSVCVSYAASNNRSHVNKKEKIDYREVLSPPEFAVYARLRALRKTLAEQQSVPPYALFNNEHLAKMVQQRMSSLEDLRTLDGIGEARAEKYGQSFLDVLTEAALPPPDDSGSIDEA